MLELEVREAGIVRLRGRLDAVESERAFALLESLRGPLTLDCAGLEYISSCGVEVVVHTWKRMREEGDQLRITDVQPRVRQVFTLAGLTRLLEID